MTTNITEKEIMRLKNDALIIRDQVISAKSTLESVLKNIKNYEDELKQLNVEPDKIDETIKEMADEVTKIYTESLETINEWKLKMV